MTSQRVTVDTCPVRDASGDLYITGRIMRGRVVVAVSETRRAPLYPETAAADAWALAAELGCVLTSDDEIRALLTSAAVAGDSELVDICGQALRGSGLARAKCAAALAAAEAQA